MPEYIVKTPNNRNLVITADSYVREDNGSAYNFYASGRKVATVLTGPELFAIVDTEATETDYYHVYDWNEEDEKEATTRNSGDEDNHDDVCLDCRFQELLDSEEFFNAVCRAYDTIQEADSHSAEEEDLLASGRIHQRKRNGKTWWGFLTTRGNFVFFSDKTSAEDGLVTAGRDNAGWSTFPIEETELVTEAS